MSKDLVARYIWLVDTLTRYRRLTREEIMTLWHRSPLSQGEAMPERTFFHYRRAVEENFHIEIKCNSYGEYYIDDTTSKNLRGLSNWLVDSYAVNNLLRDSADAADRMEVEDVPSAREFLATALEAIRHNQQVTFSYQSFSRSRPEEVRFSPYLLKRYKQRWYMYGLKENSGTRTYALDRVLSMRIESTRFELPPDVDARSVFGCIIGVTSSKAAVRTVRLETTRNQAKYLRALPLHHSQQEELHDHYSIFTYRLKLNYELVSEILALGPEVKVLEPSELRTMVTTRLRETLDLYQD